MLKVLKRWQADGNRVRRGRDGEETGDEAGGSGDETNEKTAAAGDERGSGGGVMYADEGPYTIDVRHVEEMVGRLEK